MPVPQDCIFWENALSYSPQAVCIREQRGPYPFMPCQCERLPGRSRVALEQKLTLGLLQPETVSPKGDIR
jgi:hypothetical protein